MPRYSGDLNYREPEVYGDVKLSVQASEEHYSIPRESGLELEAYEAYELGLLVPPDYELSVPSDIGLPEFDCLFSEGTVAAYADKADVNALRAALRKLAGMPVIGDVLTWEPGMRRLRGATITPECVLAAEVAAAEQEAEEVVAKIIRNQERKR